MQHTATFLDYSETKYFSTILVDYLNGENELKPFYNYPVSVEGIKAAINNRKSFAENRKLLQDTLTDQYKNTALSENQQINLQRLTSENTFTICTAHQPNIFTGHLYFIYKILHTIKLAETLSVKIPDAHFVPVYYMGSEDADLEELGHIYINGQKQEWKTNQTGAVGRMVIDKALVKMLDEISGQLLVFPFGIEIVDLMYKFYQPGITVETATFNLVNLLFAKYGLIVLMPDSKPLKSIFIPVMEMELLSGFSNTAVEQTLDEFPEKYKVQVAGRPINLFYLKDNIRERIEMQDEKYVVVNTQLIFSKEEILNELKEYPERFSPNVILRPVFQETILPNIAFVGGGGEIAYWLELKKVFESVSVPYPVLIVRNSFVLIESKCKALLQKLDFSISEIFKPTTDLINQLVKRESALQLNLDKEKSQFEIMFAAIGMVAGNVDITLQKHSAALFQDSLKKLVALEKKMLKAEKRKFAAQQRQLAKLKSSLFPHNNLQERVENFMLYYAKWGNGFIDLIYQNSLSLEQQFCVITESDK